MGGCPTPLAPRSLLTKFALVAKSLTIEAAKGVGYVDANRVSDVSSEQGVRQSGGLKGKDEEIGVLPLAVTECSQAADMGNSFHSQSMQDLLFRHESHLRRENGSFCTVA